MQAALFYGGKDIRVLDVPDPAPGPGEVLVRVRAAGICGSDLHNYRDPTWMWPGQQLPYMSGHELAGEIAALGPGVEGLRVGQRVAVEPRHLVGCGHCRECRRGDYHLCLRRGMEGDRAVGSTGFAQCSLEPAAKVYPLPEGVSLEEASLLDVYTCAVHALHRAPVHPFQTVAVLGLGAIGLAVAELYRLAGAGRVIACGTAESGLRLAQRLGAEAVNSAQADPAEAVRELTAGQGADIVIEAVGGATDTLGTCLQLAGQGGRVLVIGAYERPQTVDTVEAMFKEINLLWSSSYSLWEGVPEFKIALDLLAAGRLQAGAYITHRFPLAEIGEGFRVAANKRQTGAIKVLVLP